MILTDTNKYPADGAATPSYCFELTSGALSTNKGPSVRKSSMFRANAGLQLFPRQGRWHYGTTRGRDDVTVGMKSGRFGDDCVSRGESCPRKWFPQTTYLNFQKRMK